MFYRLPICMGNLVEDGMELHIQDASHQGGISTLHIDTEREARVGFLLHDLEMPR